MFKKMIRAIIPAAARGGARAARAQPAGESLRARRAKNAMLVRGNSADEWKRMEEAFVLSPYKQNGDDTFPYARSYLSPLGLH